MSETPLAPQPPPRDTGSRFFGWLIIVVGGLMALLCGGCTLVSWFMSLDVAFGQPSAAGAAAVPLMLLVSGIIGGIPAVSGAVLVWAGWRIVRPRRPKNIDQTFS